MNKQLIAPSVVFVFMVIFDIASFFSFQNYSATEGESFNTAMMMVIFSLGVITTLCVLGLMFINFYESKFRPE
jgi:cytochrome c biogenesis protein CcdA